MKPKERIYLYDSSLRDGAQTSTVDLNSKDKREIALMLDKFGIDYIEGGWPGANYTDDSFFGNLPKLQYSKFSAFGMTRRPENTVEQDPALKALINSPVNTICIVGKSWDFHVKDFFKISEKENIDMISSSIKHIVDNRKEAIFDAEHFFDGYKSNPEFALSCLKAAYDNGARWVTLCDTNGGTLPSEIGDIITKISSHIPHSNISIHCHNDTGNAVANSIVAVEAGARQIQGTINGLGERCGNANLITLIPTLILKMGYDVGISDKQLENIVNISAHFDELINKDKNKFAPYVGEFAFAHKGGLHASAVAKDTRSYEHINPDLVGNKRKILVSNQSGKSNINLKLKDIGINESDITKQQISDLVDKVKDLEGKGYAYDSADASFELLVRRSLNIVPEFFKLISFKVLNESKTKNGKDYTTSEAIIKIQIDDDIIMSVAEGNGPVSALDGAIKKALLDKYPLMNNIKLFDYKVRILNPSDGTEAITRVKIESMDKNGHRWSTIGVSTNIVEASYKALYDSIVFKMIKEIKI